MRNTAIFLSIFAFLGLVLTAGCGPTSRINKDNLVKNDSTIEETEDIKELTFSAPTIEEIDVDPEFLEEIEDPKRAKSLFGCEPNNKEVPGEEIPISDIVNIGKEIWKVVEDNRPVVNLTEAHASAMPRGIDCWLDLEGWQKPKAKEYRVAYKNLYGITVVGFTFRLLYTAGGNIDGKGQYLSHVTVVPGKLDVAWAYTFNAETMVKNVVNLGTKADPLASIEILVNWKVDTVLKHSQQSVSFGVYGDGDYEMLR